MEDGLSCTYAGSLGGDQAVTANLPFSPVMRDGTVKPFVRLNAFYPGSIFVPFYIATDLEDESVVMYKVVRTFVAYYEISIVQSKEKVETE